MVLNYLENTENVEPICQYVLDPEMITKDNYGTMYDKIIENENIVRTQSCQDILEAELEPTASNFAKGNGILGKDNSGIDGINTQVSRQQDPDYIQESEDSDTTEEDDNITSTVTEQDDTEDDTSTVTEQDGTEEERFISSNKRKRRKRHDVRQDIWRENINKKKREEGKEYTGKKKTHNGWNYNIKRERRVLGPRCDCKISTNNTSIQCSKLTDQDRDHIFNYFWDTLDWNQRKIYIDMLVKISTTKRQRNRKLANQSRRSYTWQYFLKNDETEIRVCKNMFLSTLCIGERSVKTWKQSQSGNEDKEGENPTPTVNSKRLALNFEKNKTLKEFFDNIPKMESHYCRASSSKLYLEPQWHTKSALYKFYKTHWCNEKQSNPVSIATFHHTFDSMNLSIFQPKKDLCDTCVAHDAGNLSNENYEDHIQKKKEAREAKESDKLSDHKVFCMDLQSVLLSPKSNVSSSYFKTKLIVHNFTIFNIKTKDGYCFIWHESAGGVSANDYSSIICQFLENSVIPSITAGQKIILFSDGCTSQNRNAVLANSLLNLSMIHNTIIEQKYLEKGHTQMEADSMHATIERKLHNRVINVPADYVGICLHAREKPRPYTVKYLDYKYFKKYDGIKFVTSLRPGRKQGDPVVTDLRAIQYSPSGEINYKLRHPDEYKKLEFRQSQKQMPVTFSELPPLYTKAIPIKKQKWDHLQQLKSSIPKDYHSFYDNLPFQQ